MNVQHLLDDVLPARLQAAAVALIEADNAGPNDDTTAFRHYDRAMAHAAVASAAAAAGIADSLARIAEALEMRPV